MQPIETKFGFLHGRDCIFLDEFHFDNETKLAILEGEINGNLCSAPRPNKWIFYKLSLLGVVKIDKTELDTWAMTSDLEPDSSFDLISYPGEAKVLYWTCKQPHSDNQRNMVRRFL